MGAEGRLATSSARALFSHPCPVLSSLTSCMKPCHRTIRTRTPSHRPHHRLLWQTDTNHHMQPHLVEGCCGQYAAGVAAVRPCVHHLHDISTHQPLGQLHAALHALFFVSAQLII